MSRGLAPEADGEGGLGIPGTREWGHVAAKELWLNGVQFTPAGIPAPTVTEEGTTSQIDLSEALSRFVPSADTTFTFAGADTALASRVMILGDPSEYRIAFSGSVNWATLIPDQLIDGVPFLFDFQCLHSDEIVGSFHGTFGVQTIHVASKGTVLAVATSVESFVAHRRAQIVSVDFCVDSGSESDLGFDLQRNGTSVLVEPAAIAGGELYGAGLLDRDNRLVVPGDLFEIDITDIGGPAVPEGLSVTVTWLYY